MLHSFITATFSASKIVTYHYAKYINILPIVPCREHHNFQALNLLSKSEKYWPSGVLESSLAEAGNIDHLVLNSVLYLLNCCPG